MKGRMKGAKIPRGLMHTEVMGKVWAHAIVPDLSTRRKTMACASVSGGVHPHIGSISRCSTESKED
jgi:hypothetical protein